MFKGIAALFFGMVMVSNVYSAAEPLDCQTSSNFEQNLDELSEVTSKVEGECPEPTKDQFLTVCQGIYNRKTIEKPGFSYTYQEDLWKISCAKPGVDSIDTARTKIQTMWNSHREKFRCPGYPTSIANDKNIGKFALDNGFSGFLIEAVKKYKLDLNFKDSADQKTVLDFVKERKEYIQNSPPVDNTKVAEYDRIYQMLQSNGAKHAKDL